MESSTIIKVIICFIGIIVTSYNIFLILKKTKRTKTIYSLQLCCIVQVIASILVLIALFGEKESFAKYLNYVSLEIIIFSLCVEVLVWLTWFKIFRVHCKFYPQWFHITLRYLSFAIFVITATFSFISFFNDDTKIIGIKRCYVIGVFVIWFSVVELVISISTFLLSYRNHKNWVKLREQQLLKLASMNPYPLKMIIQSENQLRNSSPSPRVVSTNSSQNAPEAVNAAVNNNQINNNNLNVNTINSNSEDPSSMVKINGSSINNSNTNTSINATSKGNNNNNSSSNNNNTTTTTTTNNDISKASKNVVQSKSSESIRNSHNLGRGVESSVSLSGSISKRSCLSYECIDKTILHYMHDKSVDFANTDPRAAEANIRLISLLHIVIYCFHSILSILVLVIIFTDWHYMLYFLLLYTQIEITVKLQDHFLLRQFIDIGLT